MSIEIPELGDEQHHLWRDLMDLAEAFPEQWTIIGAHMVALYAWEADLRTRPSEDVDVLVNVRLAANAAEEVSRFLRERDYEPEISMNGMAHLFTRRHVGQIDVFVPEGLGQHANRQTVPPNRTISVPGGTQALQRSRPIAVRSRDRDGHVPRPNLLGALLIKLRAIEVDDVPAAQRADVALLLQLVQDPDAMASGLSRTERRWVRRHSYFADPTDPAWDEFEADDRERAALAYARLLG
jgi:hypothetical protein